MPLHDAKALVFDLDDTLYPEYEYVRQGLAAVANILSAKCDVSAGSLYKKMNKLLVDCGRGCIFDAVCADYGIEVSIGELVASYRCVEPMLKLYEDADRLLALLPFHGIKSGIVTDGDAGVQSRKIRALSLEGRIDSIVLTDELGCCKPDKKPYSVCLEQLGVEAKSAVYIGDNPWKDFQGASCAGMATVMVERDDIRVGYPPPDPSGFFGPDMVVRSLDEIADWLDCER